VYPNPVVNIPCFGVNISGGSEHFTIEIFDMTGQLKGVIQRNLTPGAEAIQHLCLETSDLTPGSYAAVLRSDSYRVVKKFIVIK
jgi:hypothetical protein